MKILFSILFKIICILLSLFVLLWAGLAIAKVVCYPDYVSSKETVCKIPAIHNGFVPQGIAHISDNTYIFSGYNENEMELHLSKNGESIQIIPINAKGAVWELHGGGVAVAKQMVYVTAEESILVFDLNSILHAKDGARVANIAEFPVGVKTSFCFANDEYLYVGEFYDGNKYTTDQSHHVTNTQGEQHYALTAAYKLNAYGVPEREAPDFYISIRHKVQGFAVKGNTYVLSSSYGLTSSELDFYNGLKDNGSTIAIGNHMAPLYYLDDSTHTKTVKMPAFSEGLDVVGDRVVISFESACNKYIVGKLFFADKLVSYPLS